MISDHGPQFDSEFWKELCDVLQIKHAMTTAWHPQTNGGTKHVNCEIQLFLKGVSEFEITISGQLVSSQT